MFLLLRNSLNTDQYLFWCFYRYTWFLLNQDLTPSCIVFFRGVQIVLDSLIKEPQKTNWKLVIIISDNKESCFTIHQTYIYKNYIGLLRLRVVFSKDWVSVSVRHFTFSDEYFSSHSWKFAVWHICNAERSWSSKRNTITLKFALNGQWSAFPLDIVTSLLERTGSQGGACR